MANNTHRMFQGASPADTDVSGLDIIDATYAIGIFGDLDKASLNAGATYPEDSTFFIDRSFISSQRKDGTKIATVKAIRYKPFTG